MDGKFVNDSVTGTISGDTVSIAIGFAELKSSVGRVLGSKLSALTATTLDSYVATNQFGDKADGGALTYTAGAACA